MELKVGMRVKLAKRISIHSLGSFPAGAAGTVVEAGNDGSRGDPVAWVKMDDYSRSFDDWDNMLQVFDEHYSEVTAAAFVAA
jgi:hypothetical protein